MPEEITMAPDELTDTWLQSVKPPKAGRIKIKDDRVTGLVLRIVPSGAATWSIRARTRDGKQTRPTLGTYPAVGIKAARKAAIKALADVQGGGDPVAAKKAARAAREAAANLPTVTQKLAEWQRTRQADPRAPWSDRYVDEVARIIKKDIEPHLGNRTLSETTRADWTGLIAKKRAKAPAMAAAFYRVCSAFLNYAEAAGWVAMPLLPRKGQAAIAPGAAHRTRVLTDAELRAIWVAAEREAPKLRVFIRMLILTAARELEVADIQLCEVNLEAARWSIPASRTKNGCAIILPLCPLALTELRLIWPAKAADVVTLLGRSGKTGFRGFSRLKERIDDASKVAGWRWHDLRRTARTGMTRLGVSADHAEAALNHVSHRTPLERTYDQHDYTPEIALAVGKWQAHVAKIIGAAP